ncbi:hypothetical protein [Niabella hibiscisoli]|uniref:hypothetical protein n=1 Tax=Niabella hibiscisoli TaxID=1825928 RepID=UPI001F0EDA67|nr:hypothetical protein [Niabella hibiscisoli]MCH5719825.1 hypothetical protein [Niabella hibiscisoli]
MKIVMNKKALLAVFIGWLFFTVLIYYLADYFIEALVWLGLSLSLFVILIIQVLKLIRERKTLTGLRIAKVIVFSVMFYCTFCSWITHKWIDRLNFAVLYNKRMAIIEQVKSGRLKPNASWNSSLCQLPFQWPVVSHSGNDIVIGRNKNTQALSVSFYTYRNFFDAPSTSLTYTEDTAVVASIENKIRQYPDRNQRIREGWYRVTEE